MRNAILIALLCFFSSSGEIPFRIHGLDCGFSRVYIVETDSGCLLIDAGFPGEEKKVLDKLKELGRTDLKLIYITHAHFDHYGSAAALRRHTGAPIAVHAKDSAALAEGKTSIPKVKICCKMNRPFALK